MDTDHGIASGSRLQTFGSCIGESGDGRGRSTEVVEWDLLGARSWDFGTLIWRLGELMN